MNTQELLCQEDDEISDKAPLAPAEPAQRIQSESHVDAEQEPGDAEAPARDADDAVDLHCIPEIHLLILDDEPMICRAVQKALERKDFVVDAVSNPADMEAQLRANRYHAIILDYVIPGLQFDRIMSWLQDYQPNAGIIVVTGHPSVDSALNCLRARTLII